MTPKVARLARVAVAVTIATSLCLPNLASASPAGVVGAPRVEAAKGANNDVVSEHMGARVPRPALAKIHRYHESLPLDWGLVTRDWSRDNLGVDLKDYVRYPANRQMRARELSAGTRTMHFVLIAPDGERPVPVTEGQRAYVKSAVARVDDYYNDISDGKLRVKLGRIIGWVASPLCDSDLLSSSRFSELVKNRRHHVVMVKPCGSTSAAGMAQLGGNRIWLRSTSVDVIAHELGHNLGAGHATTDSCLQLIFRMTCSKKAAKTRIIDEYGDSSDVMGGARAQDGVIRGPMNPVTSAAMGLPYKAARVNLKGLKSPKSVTIYPRGAERSKTRAVSLRLNGQRVFISHAADPIGDRWGDYPQRSAPVLLAHMTPPGGYPEDSVALEVIPWVQGSGLVEGFAYPLSSKAYVRVERIDREGAQLTFGPRRGSALTNRLVTTAQGVKASWGKSPDPRVTGYRVRLLGPGACESIASIGACDSLSDMGSGVVDLDANATEYEFVELSAGSLYGVQVSPLIGDQEGVGLVSRPVMNTADMPKLEITKSRDDVKVSAPTEKIITGYNVSYTFFCRAGFQYSGSNYRMGSSSVVPFKLFSPDGCSPTSIRISLAGQFKDGSLFVHPPIAKKLS